MEFALQDRVERLSAISGGSCCDDDGIKIPESVSPAVQICRIDRETAFSFAAGRQ